MADDIVHLESHVDSHADTKNVTSSPSSYTNEQSDKQLFSVSPTSIYNIEEHLTNNDSIPIVMATIVNHPIPHTSPVCAQVACESNVERENEQSTSKKRMRFIIDSTSQQSNIKKFKSNPDNHVEVKGIDAITSLPTETSHQHHTKSPHLTPSSPLSQQQSQLPSNIDNQSSVSVATSDVLYHDYASSTSSRVTNSSSLGILNELPSRVGYVAPQNHHWPTPTSSNIVSSSPVAVRGGKKRVVAGTSCHQCKSRREDNNLMLCNQYYDKKTKRGMKRRCLKKFCVHCLKKYYGEIMDEQALGRNSGISNWVCPCCRGICSCAACKRSKLKEMKKHESKNKQQVHQQQHINSLDGDFNNHISSSFAYPGPSPASLSSTVAAFYTPVTSSSRMKSRPAFSSLSNPSDFGINQGVVDLHTTTIPASNSQHQTFSSSSSKLEEEMFSSFPNMSSGNEHMNYASTVLYNQTNNGGRHDPIINNSNINANNSDSNHNTTIDIMPPSMYSSSPSLLHNHSYSAMLNFDHEN